MSEVVVFSGLMMMYNASHISALSDQFRAYRAKPSPDSLPVDHILVPAESDLHFITPPSLMLPQIWQLVQVQGLSLTLIVYGGLRQRSCPALGGWALAALCLMIAGAVGTAAVPRAYFGIPERFSVFACAGFTAVLGIAQSRGWKRQEDV